MKKITLLELFNTIGVPFPENMVDKKNEYLENVSYVPVHIKEKGAYFCSTKHTKDRDINEFMNEVLKSKPMVVFVTNEQKNKLTIDGPFVEIDDMFNKVLAVTKRLKNKYKAKTIAITGSLGKTTTKDMIYSVLGRTFYLIKSFENENTIAYLLKNIQRLDDRQEFLIHEFGVDIPTVMPRTAAASIPEASVITNISDPHLDTLKTHEAILNEKLSMVKTMAPGLPVFLNFDDTRLRNSNLTEYKIVSIGIDNKDVDYYADNIVEEDGTIQFDVINKDKREKVEINIRGRHNVYNALIAFAIGDYYGMKKEKIVEGLSRFRPTGVRQTLVNVGAQKIYLDAYNSAPKTILSSINILESIPVSNNGRRIVLLADMARLGDQSKEMHIAVGKEIGTKDIDIIYCYGNDDAKHMSEAIKSKDKIEVHYTSDRSVLNKWVKENVRKNDILLLKGPINRLLSKTIDIVFGSSYHTRSEYYYHKTVGDFKYRIVYEKDTKAKTLVLNKYLGNAKKIMIPSTLDHLEMFGMLPYCFVNNTTLKELIMPHSIRNIAKGSFKNCKNLKKVMMSTSLNVIEQEAFRGCNKLKRIVIPEGTTHIDDRAFMDCAKLKEVIIPDTVDFFGKELFKNSPKVKFKYLVNGKIQQHLVFENTKIQLLFNHTTNELEVVPIDKNQTFSSKKYKNLSIK